MSDVELLPCPFCGGPAELSSTRAGGDTWWAAECVSSECLARGPERGAETNAIEAWNTRALSKPSPTRNEVLEEAAAVAEDFYDNTLNISSRLQRKIADAIRNLKSLPPSPSVNEDNGL